MSHTLVPKRLNILIAVETCFKDYHKHQAIRDTWGKDLPTGQLKFFIGRAGASPFEDEVFLGTGVDDSYEALSLKTQAMCRWALEYGFDYMFKCDIDTFINAKSFLFSGFSNYDYFGGENADINVPGFAPQRIEFCSGGAGYWLSNKALTIVTNVASIQTSAEDVFVANALLMNGIKPVFHPGYKWRPGTGIDKDTMTLHLSSALQKKYEVSQMYEAYRWMKEAT
jgi:hypothetical protein